MAKSHTLMVLMCNPIYHIDDYEGVTSSDISERGNLFIYYGENGDSAVIMNGTFQAVSSNPQDRAKFEAWAEMNNQGEEFITRHIQEERVLSALKDHGYSIPSGDELKSMREILYPKPSWPKSGGIPPVTS